MEYCYVTLFDTIVLSYSRSCEARLHDINKSGWWILIGLVPIIGGICRWQRHPRRKVKAQGENGTERPLPWPATIILAG